MARKSSDGPDAGARKRRKTEDAPNTKSTSPKSNRPPLSPLAPKSVPKLPPLAGVRLATGEAGIRYKGRSDVLLVTLAEGTQVAGAFTRSKTAAAPVDWCKKQLKGGSARALVVQSGNANAFTGKAGKESVEEVANAAAAIIGCRSKDVFVAATGVIGEPLPYKKVVKLLNELGAAGAAEGWKDAAEAIMTTDTFPKLATAKASIDGRTVTINGIAKGSGMIAPDMATMLAFVFTDAAIPAEILQDLLLDGTNRSFNAITVDSDTSTSDTVLLFATGKGAKHPAITKAKDKNLSEFKKALDAVLLDLALQIVRDGEGASKLIQIDVTGAEDKAAAKKIALAIANSPLVKTAIAGADANWGRVVMAVGKAGEAADRDRLKITFGGHVVAEEGMRAPGYDEAKATKAVSGREVSLAVDVGVGKGAARVWTCDFTEGYIRINASYRS
jgi:glutamate N-acetyltransferase/amino-acid N-acetyltransferase